MPKLAPIASVSAENHGAAVAGLIADFLRAARVAVLSLRQQSGASDLLRAWRENALKGRGILLHPRGKYAFHGTGCRFEVAKRVIEVDFGPRGRFDGFDAWRLGLYAESAFEWQELSPRRIEKELARLEEFGKIVRLDSFPTPHLFYFTNN